LKNGRAFLLADNNPAHQGRVFSENSRYSRRDAEKIKVLWHVFGSEPPMISVARTHPKKNGPVAPNLSQNILYNRHKTALTLAKTM
jgi:hypothetical protein